MKLLTLASALGLMFLSSLASAEVAIARAAELGCHRIERLRDLGRINEEFVTKFTAVKIERDSTGGAVFKWTGFQSPSTNGAANEIVLMLDGNGKAMGTPTVVEGNVANAPLWPIKDPVTLFEAAIHEIIDGNITPFSDKMTEGVIGQVQHGSETVARVEFKNSLNTQVYEVLIKMDGTLISKTVK